jgi:hypothetical protein
MQQQTPLRNNVIPNLDDTLDGLVVLPTLTKPTKPPRPPSRDRESTILLVKPHACLEPVWHFVLNRLELCGLRIEHYGLFKTSKRSNLDLFDKQHTGIAAAAMLVKPGELTVDDAGMQRFALMCDGGGGTSSQLDWSGVVAAGYAFNASDCAKLLCITTQKLGALWREAMRRGTVVKLGPNVWVAKLDGLSVGPGRTAPDKTFCINGFFHSLRSEYEHSKGRCLVVEVSWDEHCTKTQAPASAPIAQNQTWASLLDHVIGPADPAIASHSSLRGGVFRQWIELGLRSRPTEVNNVLHVAGSAYEAMVARSVWRDKTNADARFNLFTDPLASRLLSAGIPAQTIKWWMSDPVIQGQNFFSRVERLSLTATVRTCVDFYGSYSGNDRHGVDLRHFYGHATSHRSHHHHHHHYHHHGGSSHNNSSSSSSNNSSSSSSNNINNNNKSNVFFFGEKIIYNNNNNL